MREMTIYGGPLGTSAKFAQHAVLTGLAISDLKTQCTGSSWLLIHSHNYELLLIMNEGVKLLYYRWFEKWPMATLTLEKYSVRNFILVCFCFCRYYIYTCIIIFPYPGIHIILCIVLLKMQCISKNVTYHYNWSTWEWCSTFL